MNELYKNESVVLEPTIQVKSGEKPLEGTDEACPKPEGAGIEYVQVDDSKDEVVTIH